MQRRRFNIKLKLHTMRLRLNYIPLALVMLLTCLDIQAFNPRLDGTMMPYDFADCDSVVPWDDSYTPVFINYVARHGARYLSSEKKVSTLLKALDKAKADGTITRKGSAFLKLLNEVVEKTDGNWGALNHIGIIEEKRLGKEMAAICPELLKEGKIEASATYVPRVVMTMYELCHELARYSSGLEISTSEGRQFNPLLRFFKTDANYMHYLDSGPWLFSFSNFYRENVPTAPAASLIKGVADSHRLQKLTMDAYGVLQSLRASEIRADASQWFSEADYRSCWEVDNLKHYYQRSASSFSNLPAKCARPLLEAIINETDSLFSARKNERIAETTGEPIHNPNTRKGRFYFGHAETVIPLFSLMRLPGCYAPLLNPQDVAKEWKDWQIAPLGANLMMVCLEDKEGRLFTALRLNGKWIEMEGKKVVEWSKLKKYWEGK